MVAELLFVVERPWNISVLLGSFREKLLEWRKQFRELVTAVQSVQAQLTANEAARTTLQAQVDGMGRASGERKIGVDTRILRRPSQFNGTDSTWRDWSIAIRSYAALVRVERLPTAQNNAGLVDDVKHNTSNDPFSRCKCAIIGYRQELTITEHSLTTSTKVI